MISQMWLLFSSLNSPLSFRIQHLHQSSATLLEAVLQTLRSLIVYDCVLVTEVNAHTQPKHHADNYIRVKEADFLVVLRCANRCFPAA